jgi:hypothetical protein
MFEFLSDMGNHTHRCVESFKNKAVGLVVDTSRVSDGTLPFETGVKHPRYNSGKFVIVEAYATRDESRIGQRKWVDIMRGPLPDKLVDCRNSHIAKALQIKTEFPRESPWKQKGPL